MYHFIYETTNLVNGKKYRGKHSTDNLDDGYLGSGLAIMRAVDKYGKENFSREILQMCKDIHIAYFHEVLYVTPEWVDRDDTYNLIPGGKGGYGAKHSEETKQKLADIQRGKNHSEETKAKMSSSQKLRAPASIETRDKISESLTGRSLSTEHKAAVAKTLTGFKHSDEARKNMGDSRRGKKRGPHSEESKRNIGAGRRGILSSDETKAKISAALKGKKQSIVECPHCNKSGGVSSMKHWHFDNCKMKDNK